MFLLKYTYAVNKINNIADMANQSSVLVTAVNAFLSSFVEEVLLFVCTIFVAFRRNI